MTPPRVLTLRAMGRRVRVRAERGVPEEFLERLRVSWADCLEPEAVEPAAQPDVVVRLVGADSAPALEASGAGPGEAGSVDSAPAASGGKGSETPGPACLAVGPESTWPGAEQSFTTMVTTALLGVLVGRAHLLHAAALAPPEAVVAEGRPRALVLVGPSGRGKTTASLALARAGWAYLSDETAVIDPAQRTVIP